jgi:predicted RNase H-like nuclease (RuvC/YqgF family)
MLLFKEKNEMSEQQEPQTENVEALKARIAELEQKIAELEAENQRLREALEKAGEVLEEEIEEQKTAAIESITEKTKWSKDELKKMKLSELRLILKTIDSTKGTVKSIRSASSSVTDKDIGTLTVGDLYGRKQKK